MTGFVAEPGYAGRPVLITGATGFLGTHLSRALLSGGAQVHAIRRDSTRATRLPAEGIRWHTADLLDILSLRTAIDEASPEIVFHLAAYGTTFAQRDRDETFRVNVEGSLNLWTAMENASSRLVHTGSCGEYGRKRGQVGEDIACEPTWLYPATKNASVVMLSTLARESGREVVTLRPFGPYGAADDPGRVLPQVIRTLLAGKEMKATAGEQLRDYAHVDDHVQAFMLAGLAPLRANGVIYNIGSGEIITLRTLVETAAQAIGGDALKRVRFGALPYRDGEVWEMCCDTGAARTDLGYEPRVGLADGIARTVDWYRTAGESRPRNQEH